MRERKEQNNHNSASASSSSASGIGKTPLVPAMGVTSHADAGAGVTPLQADVSPDGGANRSTPASTNEPQLTRLLAAPRTGIADPAVSHLLTLGTTALLDELAEATSCGYALQLEARLAAFPLLAAALQAVEFAGNRAMTPYHPALARAGIALERIPRDQQLQILAWMLARGGVAIQATTLVEGVIALRDSGAPRPGDDAEDDDAEDPDESPTLGDHVDTSVAAVQSASAGMPSPINPLKWNKPRKQPGGFYIGNSAHEQIAQHYTDAHPGDIVTRNHVALSSILRLLRKTGEVTDKGALNADEMELKPDILNLTRRHLYEIKPATAQSEAAMKARMYARALDKAGVDIALGPVGEPGTLGALPAPGGVFRFISPEPGVITYQYNLGRLVPVPVPFARGARSKVQKWRWELKPIKLTPAQQHAMVGTTLGGAMLLVVMILLLPVGA